MFKKIILIALGIIFITFGLCYLISLMPDTFLKDNFFLAVETYACPILDIEMAIGIGILAILLYKLIKVLKIILTKLLEEK